MLRTKNSNKISPNENSSSFTSHLTPCLLLLLFVVSRTWVGGARWGRCAQGEMFWSRVTVTGGAEPGATQGQTEPAERGMSKEEQLPKRVMLMEMWTWHQKAAIPAFRLLPAPGSSVSSRPVPKGCQCYRCHCHLWQPSHGPQLFPSALHGAVSPSILSPLFIIGFA